MLMEVREGSFKDAQDNVRDPDGEWQGTTVVTIYCKDTHVWFDKHHKQYADREITFQETDTAQCKAFLRIATDAGFPYAIGPPVNETDPNFYGVKAAGAKSGPSNSIRNAFDGSGSGKSDSSGLVPMARVVPEALLFALPDAVRHVPHCSLLDSSS